MKVINWSTRTEFQMRGSGHIHGVIWVNIEEHEKEFPNLRSIYSSLKDGSALFLTTKTGNVCTATLQNVRNTVSSGEKATTLKDVKRKIAQIFILFCAETQHIE